MKSGFVPIAGGVVMLVFGLALVAALAKGLVGAFRRRSWPVVEGGVKLTAGPDGRKNSLAQIRYVAPDGSRQQVETKTGGMNTNGRNGQRIELSVDPNDPGHAVPRASKGTLATLGCFALVMLCFVAFGIVTIVTVLT